MSVAAVLGPFLEHDEIVTRLAGEDFMVVLEDPEQWSKAVKKGCPLVVWRWDMLNMKHQPWDRSDGCPYHLHVLLRDKGELRVRFVVNGEEKECFSVERPI